MNFSFEGNYKPKKNINLGGARSHDDKKALLVKAQAERRAREHERLRLQSAIKIQAFYRGRREAIVVRQRFRQTLAEGLGALQQHGHKASTSLTKDHAMIVSFMRQCLVLARGSLHSFAGLVRQLCDTLLSSPPSSDSLRFMRLFYDCGNDSMVIDEMTWLVSLFVVRVPLRMLETSAQDEQSLLRFICTVINPDTYSRIQRPGFIAHTTFMRIATHIHVRGHLMNILRQRLLRDSGVGEAFGIALNMIRWSPPYDYAPSEIIKWRPSPVVSGTRSMFGLFSGNTSAITPSQTAESKPTEIRLSRETILKDLVTQVFSIPFLTDRISESQLVACMNELPFSAALETLIHLYEKEGWSKEHTPLQVAGLLMNITKLGNIQAGKYLGDGFESYSLAIQYLLSDLPPTYLNDPDPKDEMMEDSDDDLSDSDAEDVVMADVPEYADPDIRERLKALYSEDKVDVLVKRFIGLVQSSGNVDQTLAGRLAGLFSTLMIRWPSQKDALLNTLLYHRWWMDGRNMQVLDLAQVLWKTWTEHAFSKIFEDDGKIMSRLNEATEAVTDSNSADIWAIVFLLCKMCSQRLLTIGDDEFFKGETTSSHLEFDQIIALSRQLKNVSFVLFWRAAQIDMEESLGLTGIRISNLRSTVTQLVQQIHARVSRRTSRNPGDWLIKDLDTGGFLSEAVAEEFLLENDTELQEHRRQPSKAKLAVISPRLGVLNNIPFVIPFEQRVEIFRMFIENDRDRNSGNQNIWQGEQVRIRRHHVFEDGFTHLYGLGAGLKRKVAISFVDEFDLLEAGIDGGGMFKEFLTSLGREAFDTNFGLFLETPDNLLYPNPGKSATEPTQLAFYEFLGLIIGKALYEGILLDVAFADFFLKKCLGGVNYLDDLPSLDPELYNGLMAVKNFRGNFEDLALDFTLTQNDNGETRTIDLIPNGNSIPVTRANCIRYVYLVANYRLNTQIVKQSKAFLRGLSTIIDVKWLRMFNQAELQILLGGAFVPIDLKDLKEHTIYSGFEGDSNKTITFLWQALESFDNTERQKFLKFVTSCSRPPLLGFRELQPKLCVRSAGVDDNRLPTSSTCVNLLKLPRFSTYSILRKKLLYAINAEAGFDLS